MPLHRGDMAFSAILILTNIYYFAEKHEAFIRKDKKVIKNRQLMVFKLTYRQKISVYPQ